MSALPCSEEDTMLKWALIFFLVTVVAAVFGFTNVAAGAQAIAKFLFFLFVVLFLIVLVFGVIAGQTLF